MPKTTLQVPPAMVTDFVTRWQGGARLPALAKEASAQLGKELPPVTVRGWIVKHLGGPAAYLAASIKRDADHPRAKPQPPVRVKRDPNVPLVDDAKVPVITAMPLEAGWKLESLVAGHVRHDVFVSPTGDRYTRALGFEPADLIADCSKKHHGIAPVRLRKLEHSVLERRAHRHARQVKRGEAAIDKTNNKKTQIRRKR